jgi:hypothetical protein
MKIISAAKNSIIFFTIIGTSNIKPEFKRLIGSLINAKIITIITIKRSIKMN